MFTTIWMCTQEWSDIARRSAFACATRHQALSCSSEFAAASNASSLRLPREGARMRTSLKSTTGRTLNGGGSLRGEAIADAEVRVDVGPVRGDLGELAPDLAHEHVDGAVAPRHVASPHQAVELLAGDHAVEPLRQHEEGLELAHREAHPHAVGEHLELRRSDFEAPDREDRARVDRLGQGLLHRQPKLKIRAERISERLVTQLR